MCWIPSRGAGRFRWRRCGLGARWSRRTSTRWLGSFCAARCTIRIGSRRRARALPKFALRNREFAEAFLKARGITRKAALREELARLGHGDGEPVQVGSLLVDEDAAASCAGLAWHLRAWGQRAVDQVRREMAPRYPTYAEFEPVRRKGRRRADRQPEVRFRRQPAQPSRS